MSGIKLICIEYKEDWELFLLWALSHNNLCRNILHNSNSVSIIGKQDDVETVVALYENKRREILSSSIDRGHKQMLHKLAMSRREDKFDQKVVEVIKSSEDKYIKSNCYASVDKLLRDEMQETDKNAKRHNDDGIDRHLKKYFPDLEYELYDIRKYLMP